MTSIPQAGAAAAAWSDPIGSDKHHWHRYGGFYRAQFARLGPVRRVLEFGVLHGASIRWLRRLFPAAAIVAIDRDPPRPDWPRDGGIRYLTADQGDAAGLARALGALGDGFDLVIEDGSHVPAHQARSLALAFPLLRPSGLYIAEDLHSALPSHPLARGAAGTSALHLLLAIERARALDRALTAAEADALAADGSFSADEVAELDRRIGAAFFHRRAVLPLSCWSCGGTAFDLARLRCGCGMDLGMEGADSLTAAVWARPRGEAAGPPG